MGVLEEQLYRYESVGYIYIRGLRIYRKHLYIVGSPNGTTNAMRKVSGKIAIAGIWFGRAIFVRRQLSFILYYIAPCGLFNLGCWAS